MAKEIERKFLVKDDSFKSMAHAVIDIRQGYLSVRPGATVRVRVTGERAFITVKGRNSGIVRDEWEYAIPAEDARQMLERCADGSVIVKDRYLVDFEGHVWEVDCFHGRHEGLVVAEIELESADAAFALPPFVDREVTGDPHYYNSFLARS